VYGYQEDVEETHGICITCLFLFFPDEAEAVLEKTKERARLSEEPIQCLFNC